jgi:undecaprenyl diphosphate synthase
MEDLAANDVRVRFIGMRDRVPSRLRALMEELEARTRGCRGLQLTLAIDYGGRDELTRAVRGIAAEVAAGRLDAEAISEPLLCGALDTRELPDPDLIVRTSGEVRVSNFLLWQAVYAEYEFPAVAWPDFSERLLGEVVAVYRRRERRFGRVGDIDARPVARAAI